MLIWKDIEEAALARVGLMMIRYIYEFGNMVWCICMELIERYLFG